MTYIDIDIIEELFPWLLPAFEDPEPVSPTSIIDTIFN